MERGPVAVLFAAYPRPPAYAAPPAPAGGDDLHQQWMLSDGELAAAKQRLLA